MFYLLKCKPTLQWMAFTIAPEEHTETHCVQNQKQAAYSWSDQSSNNHPPKIKKEMKMSSFSDLP